MSHTITNQCINCEHCYVLPCPVGAIQKASNGLLFIDSTLCNDCVGYHGTPQCASVCPTNSGCIASFTLTSEQYSTHTEDTQSQISSYWDSWFARYNYLMRRLKGNHTTTQYWQNWFDTYSDKLTSLLTQSII